MGALVWLVFAVSFNQPGAFSPAICILLFMILSNTYERKKTTLLGSGLGVFAGLLWGLFFFLPSIPGKGIGAWIGKLIAFDFVVAYFFIMFAFTGFMLASIASLYRRGAIL